MLRKLAWFISIVCHPLLIITYILIILLLINPYLFGVHSIGDKNSRILILTMFLSTFFIPMVAVLMMRALGLISSLEMPDKSDRVGPYIVTGIFYLAMFRYLLYFPNVPSLFKAFVLGSIIGLFIGFFINNFSKISMHAIGMGGLLGMVILTMMIISYNMFMIEIPGLGTIEVSTQFLLMIIILLTGFVGTSRLILNAHNYQDLYGGLLVGLASQFIAIRFFI